MQQAIEKTIPVVTSPERANFPFVVQGKNTENWNSHGSAVTLAGAMEMAQELLKKVPGLPVRIEHYTGGMQVVPTVPRFKRKDVLDEKPHRMAIWTGSMEPPEVGTRVILRIESRTGVVTGYAVHEGWLGVMVRLDEETRPDWHKERYPENPASIVYGTELKN